MFLERRLEFGYERPLDPDVHVAPVMFVLGMPGPFTGESNAAGEPDLFPSTTRTRR